MRTLRIAPFLLGVLFLFTYCQKDVLEPAAADALLELKDHHEGDPCVVVQKLWAGAGQNDITKGTEVGYVTAEIIGEEVHVTYTMLPGYTFTELHLWLGRDKYAVPKNAAPGQFPYKKTFDGEKEYTFIVPIPGGPGDFIYIAAHGVVQLMEKVDYVLPDYAKVNWEYYRGYPVADPPQFTDSYFHVDLSYAGILNGQYLGWCLDYRTLLKWDMNPYKAHVYSSYHLPASWDHLIKDNMPKINWILNYVYVGKWDLTLKEIQAVIWHLATGVSLETLKGYTHLGITDFDQVKAEKLLEKATTYGWNFVPKCGQYLGVVLFKEGQQMKIIPFPIPCKPGKQETMWAWGEYTFQKLGIAQKWGWVFRLNLAACLADD